MAPRLRRGSLFALLFAGGRFVSSSRPKFCAVDPLSTAPCLPSPFQPSKKDRLGGGWTTPRTRAGTAKLAAALRTGAREDPSCLRPCRPGKATNRQRGRRGTPPRTPGVLPRCWVHPGSTSDPSPSRARTPRWSNPRSRGTAQTSTSILRRGRGWANLIETRRWPA